MKNNDLLRSGLKTIGLDYSEAQISAFMTFLSELKKWSRAYNLTSIRKDEDIIIKHFLDSLLYLRGIPDVTRTIADAGSGAGFPGIPIKIMRSEITVSLIESSKKKAAFLRHVIRILELTEIDVIHGRLEDFFNKNKTDYDVIVSRATFKIRDLLEKICPRLRRESLIIISKGPGVSDELKMLEKTEYRDSVKDVLKLQLPFTRSTRNLVLLTCKKFSSL
jgi:16S rRNA (guanine527-N7)-methyltransferase